MLYIFIAFKSKVRNMLLPLARSFNLNQFSFLQFFFKESIFYYFINKEECLLKMKREDCIKGGRGLLEAVFKNGLMYHKQLLDRNYCQPHHETSLRK